MFDAPRVLEKGDARAQQNDQIVLVLPRRQHALVQQQWDLRHRIDAHEKLTAVVLAIDSEGVEKTCVVAVVRVQWQDTLHVRPSTAVAIANVGLHGVDESVDW